MVPRARKTSLVRTYRVLATVFAKGITGPFSQSPLMVVVLVSPSTLRYTGLPSGRDHVLNHPARASCLSPWAIAAHRDKNLNLLKGC